VQHVIPLVEWPISVTLTLISLHNAYFHYVIKYGILFGGNYSNSGKIFILQKQIVRIMAGAYPKTSCRSLFKKLEILSVPCQYILLFNELHYQ